MNSKNPLIKSILKLIASDLLAGECLILFPDGTFTIDTHYESENDDCNLVDWDFKDLDDDEGIWVNSDHFSPFDMMDLTDCEHVGWWTCQEVAIDYNDWCPDNFVDIKTCSSSPIKRDCLPHDGNRYGYSKWVNCQGV